MAATRNGPDMPMGSSPGGMSLGMSGMTEDGLGTDQRMSDQNDQDAGKSRLSLRPAGGRLELGKTVDAGSVRQSFSHGRSKTVQVEVVKKRTVTPPAPRQAAGPAAPVPSGGGPRPASPAPASGAPARRHAAARHR